MFLTHSNVFRFVIASIPLIAFIGCTEKFETLSTTPSASAEIKTIAITPSPSNVAVLQSVQLHAIASYSDGSTADVTSTAAWVSSTTAVAAIAAQGLLTCETAGNSQVSVTAGEVVANVPLTCSNAPTVLATTIQITPTSPAATVQQSVQMHAIASYSDGSTADVTSTAAWASGTTAVAVIVAQGLLTCEAAGNSQVSVTAGGVVADAPLTCSSAPAVIKTIAITPSPSNVNVQQSAQLHAIASYSDGSTADITSTAAWVSGTTAVAVIAAQGLLTCEAAGSSQVSAGAGGVVGSSPLTCTSVPPVIKAIAITPPLSNVNVQQSAQLHAIASYSDGSTADITSTASWASSATAVASIQTHGLLTCEAAGSSQVSAGAGGVVGSSPLTCTSVPPVIKAIAITPPLSNVNVQQSTQLHAIASYADGSTADITSTASWASSATAIASIQAQGLLTCEAAGSSQVSAGAGGVVGNSPLTCTGPKIADVRLGTTPSVIRSEAPFQYQLLADYANGTTTDVTASASWATDSGTASVSSNGLVDCNHPGATTISGTFSGMTIQAPFTCVLHSITAQPGFVESAATFDGPFSSWVNIKTAFGAKGDGVTDDTVAIQSALASLTQHPAVLWFPHGTYVITRPLSITGLSNITILGEDPLITTLSWNGPTGGTMLTLSGCNGFNIGRLTLDGRGSSGVGLEITWNESSNYYPTRNLIHDSRMLSTATGIHTGWAGETTVERVHFDHNTQAGLSLGDWNALNWNVVDCLFTDDAIGVTNTFGAGAFNVTNSVFERSTVADVAIGNTGGFSLRSNLSVNSKMFLRTGMTGAPANIILQGNTIYNPTSTPVETGTPGSLLLLDNQFLDLNQGLNIIYSFCASRIHFISVGNTYAVTQPFGGYIGSYTSIDEANGTVVTALPWAVPTEVYIPPLSHRQVFDVPPGSSSVELQAAINSAVAVGGIVHLPAGNYNIAQTLEIPANANIAILGDGSISDLVVNRSLQGPAISSFADTLQMDDFRFSSYSTSPTDALIELHIPDVPSTNVFCDECTIDDQITGAFAWDGLDDANMEFRVMGAMGINGTLAADVHGGTARQNDIPTLGNIGEFMASSGEYEVDLGGHFLNEDGFHDTGQGPVQLVLTGDGSVTQQGGYIGTSANPAMALNNYQGRFSLIGAGTTSYVNITGTSPSNVFVAGVVQVSGVSPLLSSDSNANIVGISNFATPPNGSPSLLPDTPATPSQIEDMMSMARTQILVHRQPIQFASTIVKMTRLLIEFDGVGIHVINRNQAGTGGSYSITSVGGSSVPQTSCNSGDTTMAGTWNLQPGGDGFMGLSRSGSVLSEGAATQSNGNPLITIGAMISARDRWLVIPIGDGSIKIENRATGDLLTQASDGCAYAAQDSGIASQHWLIGGAE
jgi:hypothetical protein